MLDKEIFFTLANEALFGLVLASRADGKIRYLNAAAAAILEIENPAEALDRLEVEDLFEEQVRRTPLMNKADLLLLEGNVRDIGMRKLDGNIIVANIGLKRFKDSRGVEMLLLSFQDVSLEKRLERDIELKQKGLRDALHELSEQNKELAKLDDAKTRFIYLVTHELRTPLTALITSAELMMAEIYENAEDENTLKKTLYSQSLLLLEIVNDVLDLTKIKTGSMEYYVEAADPRPIMRSVLETFKHHAEQKGIVVESSDDLSANALAYFDPIRLRQVFGNLISNAIKFSRDKSKIHVHFSQLPSGIKITVRDFGVGIPRDLHPKVFTEFATLGEMKTHSQGTGLGLAICKSILSEMGGRISFRSEEGKGSSFFVELPNQQILDPLLYRKRRDGLINLLEDMD